MVASVLLIFCGPKAIIPEGIDGAVSILACDLNTQHGPRDLTVWPKRCTDVDQVVPEKARIVKWIVVSP